MGMFVWKKIYSFLYHKSSAILLVFNQLNKEIGFERLVKLTALKNIPAAILLIDLQHMTHDYRAI